MAAYCECGDVATRFSDQHGNELEEPMCDECYNYSLYRVGETLRLTGTKPIEDSIDSGPSA